MSIELSATGELDLAALSETELADQVTAQETARETLSEALRPTLEPTIAAQILRLLAETERRGRKRIAEFAETYQASIERLAKKIAKAKSIDRTEIDLAIVPLASLELEIASARTKAENANPQGLAILEILDSLLASPSGEALAVLVAEAATVRPSVARHQEIKIVDLPLGLMLAETEAYSVEFAEDLAKVTGEAEIASAVKVSKAKSRRASTGNGGSATSYTISLADLSDAQRKKVRDAMRELETLPVKFGTVPATSAFPFPSGHTLEGDSRTLLDRLYHAENGQGIATAAEASWKKAKSKTKRSWHKELKALLARVKNATGLEISKVVTPAAETPAETPEATAAKAAEPNAAAEAAAAAEPTAKEQATGKAAEPAKAKAAA